MIHLVTALRCNATLETKCLSFCQAPRFVYEHTPFCEKIPIQEQFCWILDSRFQFLLFLKSL